MRNSELFLVVMAGGSGTRFWPKSTSKKPKQLLSFGGSTLIAQTFQRFESLVPSNQRIVVTTQLLEDSVAREVPGVKILAEPQGRNTAPCVYWAARAIAEINPRGMMLVMPSDHYIAKPDRFVAIVKAAAEWASLKDDLVTLGVQPTRPETGYGYLKIGAPQAGTSCRTVEAFVEKPNLEKAKQFLSDGNYLWNGGMFVWRVDVILAAFDKFMPEMREAWESSRGKVQVAYPKMTATSIDYGIMEKAKNVVSFPLDCGWDDLGSWTSLEGLADVLHARSEGSVVTGGEILSVESGGNIVDAPERLVALLGVKDLIIVEHGGAILVADKNRAQDIRLIVDRLKKQRPELV